MLAEGPLWAASGGNGSGVRIDPDRTEVRLTHLGWEQFGEEASNLRAAHEAGWRFHLDQLGGFCER